MDSATIEVEIGLVMNAEAACNRAISVADPAEEGIFAKETELELPVLICREDGQDVSADDGERRHQRRRYFVLGKCSG